MNAALVTAVIGATATVLAALLATDRGRKRQLQSIELKVDGRLEAALVKIDRLEGLVASLTDSTPPPLVGGQNLPPPK